VPSHSRVTPLARMDGPHLRRASDATMRDAEFLAEAARMQADVAPTSGEEVQALVFGRI
jgi:propanediol dehydratase small subunit